MTAPHAALPYTGADGEAYLRARSSSLSDRNQALRASLFADLGDSKKTILDFGCGAGGVLGRIAAGRRIGIEIGASAARLARAQGLDVFSDLSLVEPGSVDVAISFHALEHVDDPLGVLRGLRRVVKPGGTVRVVAPGELAILAHQRRWRPNNDRHLFTWTPLLLGNLAQRAGFADFSTRVAPMPTRSRLVRALRPLGPPSRAVHWLMAIRRNALNVILDATVPLADGRTQPDP